MKQFVLPFEPVGDGPEKHRLAGRDFKYLVRVRRYRAGDRISAVSPTGAAYELEFRDVGRDSCEISIAPAEKPGTDGTEQAVRLTLMPGITKGRKMDLTVRQAVEAGVSFLKPLITDFCQIRYSDAKDGLAKTERWSRIAREALQQCGGAVPMAIDEPKTLDKTVSGWNRSNPLFFFHESPLARGGLHRHLAEPASDIGIIVGPEGGLSPGETELLLDTGAIPVHLGTRVLRAETAALYAVAAISTIIRENDEWRPL